MLGGEDMGRDYRSQAGSLKVGAGCPPLPDNIFQKGCAPAVEAGKKSLSSLHFSSPGLSRYCTSSLLNCKKNIHKWARRQPL